MNKHPNEKQTLASVSSEIYDDEYYLAHCDGFTRFSEAEGEKLPARLEYAWQISQIRPGMQVLDIGFGRGETFYQGHQIKAKIYGLDFSVAAIRIAKATISFKNLSGALAQADAKLIPFKDESFDRILMFDVVEHLHPWELEKTYREAWRILKPEGQLVIHTAPNLWYYQIGYPLYRFLEKLRGHTLPVNPRDRFKFHNSVHVNEQSILTLSRELSKCGFKTRTWLAHIPKENHNLPLAIRLISPALYNLPPLFWIFRNDVFAIATKPAVRSNKNS